MKLIYRQKKEYTENEKSALRQAKENDEVYVI